MRRRLFLYLLNLFPAGMAGLGASRVSRALTPDNPTETLFALVDTVVPRDHDPGALDVGVGDALRGKLDEQSALARALARCIEGADELAARAYETKYAELDQTARERLFRAMMGEPSAARIAGWAPDPALKAATRSLRRAVIRRYYLDPAGQASVGYTPPWPDGYRPDING